MKPSSPRFISRTTQPVTDGGTAVGDGSLVLDGVRTGGWAEVLALGSIAVVDDGEGLGGAGLQAPRMSDTPARRLTR
jgi:hypothetical protein